MIYGELAKSSRWFFAKLRSNCVQNFIQKFRTLQWSLQGSWAKKIIVKPLGRVGLPRDRMGIRRLGELHAGDEGVGDGDFFGEGDDRGLDGEVFDHEVGRPEGSQPVAGAALEDEVAEGEEFFFVLGVAATGHEVGYDDDVIGEVVVAVGVLPDFELDVDVASEVAEGCADAVPVADCIIVVGLVALGDVDAEVVEQVFDAVGDDC